MKLFDHSMARRTVLSAFCLSLAAVLCSACSDDGGFGSDAATVDALAGATVSLSWQIRDPDAGSAVLACDEVAASAVRLALRPVGGGSGSNDSFTCASGSVTSRVFNPGTYNIDLVLVAGLAELDTVTIEGVALALGKNTQLDPVDFAVVPRSNLTFQIDTALAGPNCASNSAGITEMRIELRNSNGICEPATFSVDDGRLPYNSDCASATTACIENDRSVTATIPSGTRMLSITGRTGTDACFTRLAQFEAPGNNLTADLGKQLLVVDTGQPGCTTSTALAGPALPTAL
ncbi:MAG: hypothetical protein MJE77_29550 [Proteobacteria bacterium]|nr:hypothetical protein [Pseudomonadota bacterium]